MTAPEPASGPRTWTQGDVHARDLLVGDVIADRRGLLWSVAKAQLDHEGAVQVEIVRGTTRRATAFAPTKEVATLLTADDARALDLLAAELGASPIRREAA